MKKANHEIWRNCPLCGCYEDLRKTEHCSQCGTKLKAVAMTEKWLVERLSLLFRMVHEPDDEGKTLSLIHVYDEILEYRRQIIIRTNLKNKTTNERRVLRQKKSISLQIQPRTIERKSLVTK